ncbi:MAG: IS21 family transposase [Acetobacteraceae bacterium]
MPGERMSMRKIREVLRLRLGHGLAQRAIGQSLRLSQGTVSEYLKRAQRAGLEWPLPDDVDDACLEGLLFPPPPDVPAEQRPVPDWSVVHREMRRPNVTLALLWDEYRTRAADGFGYSWFCDLYRAWVGRLKPTLRQVHVAGEKLFVDFAGHTMEVVDGATGEIRRAEIFVAVLGASSFIYAEAIWSQTLPDWIGAHVNALAAIGGVPRQIVCDNLKSGITKACFHEPTVNRTYADMAAHYGTAIIPARPYKPRDKAKVEVGVQVVQRWILARLRNRRFFSLAELNSAIRALVADINDRPMRSWDTTRRALFEQFDHPALLPLPPTAYEYADWKRCRVNLDYHVEIAKHFYSVPFQLLRQEVEARITTRTVEIFHRGKLVAAHRRSPRAHRPTTLADHMPSSHRRYRDWTHERILREAAATGDDTAALVEVILRSRPHPEQGFRSCIGILGLSERYGAERVDAACAKALALGARSYGSVSAILKNAQEKKAAPADPPSLFHENIRGPGYYH